MIFTNTIISGEGVGWAVTDEMTLKHASLQLSLHLRTRAPAYPPLKKEKTDSFPKRGNIRCTSLSKNMVGRSGRWKIQRTTSMGVRRWCSSKVHHCYSPLMGLCMVIFKTVCFSGKKLFTISRIVIF